MNHYRLLDETSKKEWKALRSPEEAAAAPRLSAVDARTRTVERYKNQKMLAMKIEVTPFRAERARAEVQGQRG